MNDSLNRPCSIGSRPSRMWMNEACDSAASSLCVECVAKSVGPSVSAVVEERAEGRHPDGQIRPEHVLAEIVAKRLRHGRLEEGGASEVAWRAEGVLVDVRVLEHRVEHRREQLLTVASNRGLDASGHEGGRILEQPDELVRHLQCAQRHAGNVAALAEQEHRGSVVAAAKRAQHARSPILVVQIDVDHQAADQRVGSHDRDAVVGGAATTTSNPRARSSSPSARAARATAVPVTISSP